MRRKSLFCVLLNYVHFTETVPHCPSRRAYSLHGHRLMGFSAIASRSMLSCD